MTTLNFNAANVKPIKAPIEDQPRETGVKFSTFQQDIFNFVEFGQGNALVEAVAGSGKTFTIVEANKRVNGSSIFLAFNKSIAEELKNRGINARTFHSLTFNPVLEMAGTEKIESDKMRLICKEYLSPNDNWIYGASICKLVSLAKQCGFGCLVQDTEKDWLNLINHFGVEPDSVEAEEARLVELSFQMLAVSTKEAARMMDFDDLLYLSILWDVALPKFDFVFVDEAQDTNAIQRAILKKLLKPNSRIVAVGDPAQAIYGFRGADSDSLDLIASEFNCIRLPLSISYRCAKNIVNHAQKWVSHIQPAESAPEGEVLNLDKWDNDIFSARDLVVCRTTAPLMSLAFSLLKAHIPVTVLGREIGQSLKIQIKKFKTNSLADLSKKLEVRLSMDLAKAGDDKNKVGVLTDKHDAIRCLIDSLDNEETVDDLLNLIDRLFAEKLNSVMLATIHKSKGLEAHKVFWLNSSKCPSKWAEKEWEKKQEINLCYVATTRAKETLVLIER